MGEDTMLAALHGELAVHPWHDPETDASDAYSLFFARSSAMAWLTDAAPDAHGGLWGMNDAGQDDEADSPGPMTRKLWFQVSLTGSAAAERPLPTQPFLSCAGDVAARIGVLNLRALQILVPVPIRAEAGGTVTPTVLSLLQEAGWLADTDSRLARRVQVILDGGQVPSIVDAAPGMLAWMRTFEQGVFSCDPTPARGDADEAAGLVPGIADHLWNGPGHHCVTVHGTLAEWSLDALGWLIAFLAEAGAQHGVRDPLVLTVRTL
ncbi:hypothetical protein GCM10007079_51710 [Nocardiopsis terrae]|uniref:Uncharacterized protein n=1 Tax=Nocardiopsis terrae TaxID=372655 RepID=A0ABR9HB65_9ACTN|nr:hypothetical protein [Nocardiopsis terrae]MBE1456146.1 hypothetical protein [Nocardiopsis terrae]GHC97875.1 hypothetical protein GCM10007079_51710 [Nocardiopsis terrae]